MLRHSVDKTISYAPEDLILFRGSPFAAWMERLTFENPDHGIPADSGPADPMPLLGSQDALVETLREEGRRVTIIDAHMVEEERRALTLDALQAGADFVVNGVLAYGAFAGTASLLMRTSGYSNFGDFLYVPCAQQYGDQLDAGFRLGFFADLLHSVQGQLPPQMLIIRNGADVVPLNTDDFIHYYRAVQLRFIQAMNNFRPDEMPNPADSTHFGRWAECAAEVLKQRAEHAEPIPQQRHATRDALPEDAPADSNELDEPDTSELPARLVSGSDVPLADGSPTELTNTSAPTESADTNTQANTAAESDTTTRIGGSASNPVADSAAATSNTAGREAGLLVDQARRLKSGQFYKVAPGHTPNVARSPGASAEQDSLTENAAKDSDVALQNLEFIGSSTGGKQASGSALSAQEREKEERALAALMFESAHDSQVSAPPPQPGVLDEGGSGKDPLRRREHFFNTPAPDLSETVSPASVADSSIERADTRERSAHYVQFDGSAQQRRASDKVADGGPERTRADAGDANAPETEPSPRVYDDRGGQTAQHAVVEQTRAGEADRPKYQLDASPWIDRDDTISTPPDSTSDAVLPPAGLAQDEGALEMDVGTRETLEPESPWPDTEPELTTDRMASRATAAPRGAASAVKPDEQVKPELRQRPAADLAPEVSADPGVASRPHPLPDLEPGEPKLLPPNQRPMGDQRGNGLSSRGDSVLRPLAAGVYRQEPLYPSQTDAAPDAADQGDTLPGGYISDEETTRQEVGRSRHSGRRRADNMPRDVSPYADDAADAQGTTDNRRARSGQTFDSSARHPLDSLDETLRGDSQRKPLDSKTAPSSELPPVPNLHTDALSSDLGRGTGNYADPDAPAAGDELYSKTPPGRTPRADKRPSGNTNGPSPAEISSSLHTSDDLTEH